uniref:V-type proton ATPase subunit a n=1 Tax=Lactuca sativa TaxID=4236 RepID=A0A9R1XPH9_LACSA|nr:hypothetical protein LSAT_V11C200082960 [Lactuca sativa]
MIYITNKKTLYFLGGIQNESYHRANNELRELPAVELSTLPLDCALVLIAHEGKLSTQKLGSFMEMLFGGRYVLLLMSFFSIYYGLIYNELFSVPYHIFGASAYRCRDPTCSKVEVQNSGVFTANPKIHMVASWEPTVLATIIIPSECGFLGLLYMDVFHQRVEQDNSIQWQLTMRSRSCLIRFLKLMHPKSFGTYMLNLLLWK